MEAHAHLAAITLLRPRSSAAAPTLFAGALAPTPLADRAAAAVLLLLATAAPATMLGWLFLG